MALKVDVLKNAKDVAKLQAAMKADLKKSVGKKNLKYVAAKNYLIGTKKTSLFILTDTPTVFENLMKLTQPTVPRAKGTVDVLKGAKWGTYAVTIRSASGLTREAVAGLVKVAVASEKSITATAIQTKVAPTVGDWVKEEYRQSAKRTLIASMTPDGKIGSVYFSDGRIRTTHGAGPAAEGHGGQKTVQFNLDNTKAFAYYEGIVRPKMTRQTYRPYDEWLAEALNNTHVDRLPDWVKVVKGPQDAHDLSKGAPTGELTLFEIFTGINGRVEGWHPSRGTATKFETDKQTVSVLRAAIKYIDGVGSPKIPKVTDPDERNVKFYAFVKSRLPKFVPFMREPKDV